MVDNTPLICIYGLRLIGSTEIRYVGKTIVGRYERFKGHVGDTRRGCQLPSHRWMRKHGVDKVEPVLLEACDFSELDAREQHWINSLPNLVNLRGKGSGPGSWSAEERVRMGLLRAAAVTDEERLDVSVRMKSYYADPANLEAMRQRVKQQWEDPNIRQKMGSYWTGKSQPESMRNKRSDSLKAYYANGGKHSCTGVPRSEEQRNKHSAGAKASWTDERRAKPLPPQSDETKAKRVASIRLARSKMRWAKEAAWFDVPAEEC